MTSRMLFNRCIETNGMPTVWGAFFKTSKLMLTFVDSDGFILCSRRLELFQRV
jgi:hypothetical protein